MPDDASQFSPSPLVAAGRMLAERGVYGLIWFDEELRITARYGHLVDSFEIGEPLLGHCLPLIGLEADLHTLKESPGRVIDLPAIRIVNSFDGAPRLNLTVLWHAEGRHYLMLIARSTSRSDLEADLSKQMRARLIAETIAAEKSRELSRANAELARANRDLEDFAAIVSHDLKSPLRALRYASEDLAASLETGDMATASMRLEEIGKRTRRMNEMMTSLLDYASVGRKSEIAESVETRAIVETVVASLAVPGGFTIDIEGDWPNLTTVKAAFDLVLRNLVQNAIVHHDRKNGHIVITATDQPRHLVVTIADDGPGIDPAHHASILLPFRTLAPKDGSTGMGLAFVNRTIETVGGTMAVQSDPAKARGTTFKLSWPKRIFS